MSAVETNAGSLVIANDKKKKRNRELEKVNEETYRLKNQNVDKSLTNAVEQTKEVDPEYFGELLNRLLGPGGKTSKKKYSNSDVRGFAALIIKYAALLNKSCFCSLLIIATLILAAS